ncbi:MAG: NAD-dependent deacylase [Bacteroidetes bacterium]|nr:NAD-dependent deacylase [Bacteroidota bacterium]MBL6963701.1 NAD-dependent deacylase [Bacteroidota bacterium]
MKKLVVLSGAGISAESGIQTYRDSGGLWKQYDFVELASPQGWAKHPDVVLDFYNVRRKIVREAKPNDAHTFLLKLEEKYDVTIITQNVDDLHERAGSSNILHLHGEIMKAKSTYDESLVYELGDKDINMGDLCEKGYQLRPQVVWFGEMVPMISEASRIVASADIFIVIGTGLTVYPAAGLIRHVPDQSKKYIIDKSIPDVASYPNLFLIEKPATEGVRELVAELLKEK